MDQEENARGFMNEISNFHRENGDNYLNIKQVMYLWKTYGLMASQNNNHHNESQKSQDILDGIEQEMREV